MRLHFKEEPKEWRKVTLLGLIGPAAILGLLRYRGVVSATWLGVALALLALVALCAWARPRWFRGYYRFTTRLGFYTVQVLGRVVLAAFFFVVLTPFGCLLRMFGKDLLQLKSPCDKQTGASQLSPTRSPVARQEPRPTEATAVGRRSRGAGPSITDLRPNQTFWEPARQDGSLDSMF